MKSRTLLVAAALAACSHGAPPRLAPVPRGTAVPAFEANRLQRDLLSMAGLRTLENVRLREGSREVRVWSSSMGYPQRLYRLMESRNGVRGEVLLYWPTRFSDDDRPGETFHDLIVYSHQGSCAGLARTDGVGFCRAVFAREPDWAGVLRRLDERGLETLPDPSTFPKDGILTLDGWGFQVEYRRGCAYRTYEYNNPQSHPSWPTAAQATALFRTLSAVDSLVRRSDSERVYTGITTGTYNAAFRLCDGRATWHFSEDLREAQRREPRPRWTVGDDTTTAYQVTVRGQASPEWLARRWEAVHPRVLNVYEILDVRPAPSGVCEQ